MNNFTRSIHLWKNEEILLHRQSQDKSMNPLREFMNHPFIMYNMVQYCTLFIYSNMICYHPHHLLVFC